MATQKPVHVIRLGRIKAAIWENQSPSGTWYNVQVRRVYCVEQDGRSEWKQADSFGRDDLPLVCKALDQAHTWIYQTSRQEAAAPGPVESGNSEFTGADDAEVQA